MSLSRFSAGVAVLAVASVVAVNGADKPYEEMMKATAAACGNVKKDLDAKNLESAAANAKALAAGFKEIHGYWKKQKTADATAAAETAQKASVAVEKAAKAGKLEDAQAAFKNVTGTCKGCHDAHREKGPDGKWKVKA